MQPEPVESHSLSPIQLQAASLLAAGQSTAEVARQLNLSRTTLYTWRALPHFAAYLHNLIQDATEYATARATAIMQKSLQIIESALADATDPARQLALAFKMLSLYSRPAFLRYIHSLPTDPRIIANHQLRDLQRSAPDQTTAQPSTEQNWTVPYTPAAPGKSSLLAAIASACPTVCTSA